MTSPLSGISVTVLFVGDLAASTAFYRDALDATLINQDEQSSFFELAGSKVLLLNRDGAVELVDDGVATDSATRPKGELVSFVEDVDQTVATLANRGVTFLRGPENRRWGMRTAHFTDPDGHVWEIAQSVDLAGPHE